MNITGLGRASIFVRNLQASERFYATVLRMPIVARGECGARVQFRVGRSNQLELQAAATNETNGPSRAGNAQHIAFVVGNNPRTLEDARRHLAENGIAFEQVTHEEYESLYLRDPDGHLVELYYWPEW